MNYLQLSSFAAITGTFFMELIYIYLYVLYRERFMGLWISSWTVFFVRVILFDSGLINWKETPLDIILYQMIYILCTFLFLYGTHVFIERSLTRYWKYIVLITIGLSIIFSFSQVPLSIKLVPPTWFATVVLIHAGTIFINIKTRGMGRYITGGAFIVWGIFTALIPLYAYNDELPWWISLICGISRLFIAIGIISVYFEKTRADLIINQESLQQTNRELNNFCHSVAHDLKAPLLLINRISGQLMQGHSDKLNSVEHELIQHMQEKSVEVIKITDHLLELCKMSEMPMKVELIQLETLFREVYDELIKIQPERQVEFRTKQLPVIYGDTVMIKLLVRNILSNALKFTRNRKQAIIEVDTKEAEDNYVISVKDNGAGFDMRYSSKLFGVFERLHSDNEFEGSGVGLAISQKILKRHNGKAWLTGKVDEGAVFSFRFPKLLPQHHSMSMLVAPDTMVS